jgi:RHS repeat-associated protein
MDSDGSSDLFINDEFSIHVQPDGSQKICYKLDNANNSDSSGQTLGIFSVTEKSQETKSSLGKSHSTSIQFTDTKGSVTHTFSGKDASLIEKLEYDDFGLLDSDATDALKDETIATYKGKYLDKTSGLLNFGARWYDPLVGRFTTPDDIHDIDSILRTDGLNRYVFANNDPINHVDPTGHWSWSAIVGVVVSAVLIVGAVALMVATGGAVAPLVAAGVGAFLSGGIAGLTYSLDHKDEEDAGKFWYVHFFLTILVLVSFVLLLFSRAHS